MDIANSESRPLDVYDIAKIFHISPKYARDLVKSGLLKAEKTGEIKVSPEELVRFLIENEEMDLTDPFNPKPLNFNQERGKKHAAQ